MARRHYLAVRGLAAVFALLIVRAPASASTATLDISQFAHAAWTDADGFTKGSVHAIAQTPDGYLWLGTDFGLVRFDGVRTTPWPSDRPLPSNRITSLITTRDGTLWIGTRSGLASWKEGSPRNYAELSGQLVLGLVEDRDGTVWLRALTSPRARLCTIRDGRVRCWEEDSRFGPRVRAMYEDRKGQLWFAEPHGLWRWNHGQPTFHPLPNDLDVQALSEDADGVLLVVLPGRVDRFVDGTLRQAYKLPGTLGLSATFRVFRDRDGGVWIGSLGAGLAHVHDGRIDQFSRSDRLTSDGIEALFQDREGNIWVGTHGGFDRFRELPATPLTGRQGFSSLRVTAVVASTDGSMWVRTVDGLNHWENGRVTVYRTFVDVADRTPARAAPQASDDLAIENAYEVAGGSLFQDERGRIWLSGTHALGYMDHGRFVAANGVPRGRILAITGDVEGNVWLAHQTAGLLRMSGSRAIEQIPWERLGHRDYADTMSVDPSTGGLWLGFFHGGVELVKNSQVRESYAAKDGLPSGRVKDLRIGRDGALWIAAAGGTTRLKNGRFTTLSARDGLPCDEAHWTIEDDAGDLWISAPCGLVRIARAELERWEHGADVRGPASPRLRVTVLDSSDGVPPRANVGAFSPHVAKAPDGRLWFFPLEGLIALDPRHVSVNTLPPRVHVEQINADHRSYRSAPLATAGTVVQLPARSRDIDIGYTGLSFANPQKIRFRYKLDGRDLEWQDAGTRRQVFYSDLAPGRYRFHVTASNSDGVWDEAGTSIEFMIAPAYYQTVWFRAIAVAAGVTLLWGLYRIRVRQLAHEFDTRLQERVNERTRIARELHDTLLQSLHGLMFRFQAARNMLPGRTREAMQTLDDAILRTEQAIAESRDAIQDLRSASADQQDLGRALATFGNELTASETPDAPIFRVTIEGEPRLLPSILHDELCRIARELIRNAFRHARAHRIETEIRYEDRLLCLRIRDDGIGIEPKILYEGGRAGHWGLRGIRERAQAIGAQLDVWSEAGAGTEVQLRLPAAIAFRSSTPRS
jgi:signal transduction histidine kinase/ligand-binding sensor domain-containing protein